MCNCCQNSNSRGGNCGANYIVNIRPFNSGYINPYTQCYVPASCGNALSANNNGCGYGNAQSNSCGCGYGNGAAAFNNSSCGCANTQNNRGGGCGCCCCCKPCCCKCGW